MKHPGEYARLDDFEVITERRQVIAGHSGPDGAVPTAEL